MTIKRRLSGWLVGLALLLAGPAVHAFAEAENENASIEAIGAIRLTGAYFHYPDVPYVLPEDDDGLAAGEFRLILEGNLWQVDYDVNFFADLSRVPEPLCPDYSDASDSSRNSNSGTFNTAGSYKSPYRTTYLTWTYWDDGPINGQLGLDYFSIYYQRSPMDITVGRFPVNYSVTNIFTPNDFFVPFSASAINKIYKPGVDAVRLGFSAGTFTNVEIVGVMGNNEDDVPSWAQSALLARASTVALNIEWSVLGGKLAERWFVGASIQGEAGPIGIRVEGHAGFPDQDGDGFLNNDEDETIQSDIYGRLSAGLEAMFPWQNAMIGLEYAFYSDG
ncbi:MAG: hypothetical protein GY762_02185, partial [Proteobacteria bacterium]|nr:hypothetical protein [Pseudomonadota bacterium]